MDKTVYQKLKESSGQMRENNDCAVVATAVVTQSDYSYAHALLKNFGRQDRKGTNFYSTTKVAIESIGFRLEVVNPLKADGSRYTPKTISKICQDGFYLCRVKGHIFAVANGQVMDWTEGRAHRINFIYKVIKNSG
jgi:hypothetical protein